MKFLYVLDDCEFNGGKLYSILYRIYGIKHMKVLEQFEYEKKSDLDLKYTGYINLTTIWNEGFIKESEEWTK
jgi:hypothetical protein